MQQLVKLVQEKAGLGEEQAQQAVDTVVGFLKQKLPAPIAAQIDAVLASEATTGRATDALKAGTDRLGGFLGKGEKK
jgi:uncharacterized protein (DUF2267 family)